MRFLINVLIREIIIGKRRHEELTKPFFDMLDVMLNKIDNL